jgi:uncharacterized protein HemY
MRALLWVVTLFGVAVGLVTLAQAQQGIVQFVFPSMRVELAFSLFLLLLLLFGIAFGTLLRLVRAALSLPRRVSAHRQAVAERRARGELDAALRAYFENRWVRAERHAARAIELAGDRRPGADRRCALGAGAAAVRLAPRLTSTGLPRDASSEERWMAELARAGDPDPAQARRRGAAAAAAPAQTGPDPFRGIATRDPGTAERRPVA